MTSQTEQEKSTSQTELQHSESEHSELGKVWKSLKESHLSGGASELEKVQREARLQALRIQEREARVKNLKKLYDHKKREVLRTLKKRNGHKKREASLQALRIKHSE